MSEGRYCDEHCRRRPGHLGQDQPCLGDHGHVSSRECASCESIEQAIERNRDRAMWRRIEEKRNDPEFMARLQRHLDENRAALDRLAEL